MLTSRLALPCRVVAVVGAAAFVASCGPGATSTVDLTESAAGPTTRPTPDTTTPALVPTPTATAPPRPVTTVNATTTTSTNATTTTTSTSSTTSTTLLSAAPPSTSSPAASTAPPTSVQAVVDSAMPHTNAVFETLARNNTVASITVRRDGTSLLARASGTLIDGSTAGPDSPMLVASVSKIVTAIGIARLIESGDLTADQAVPWATIGLAPHPKWNDVSIRELLDHTSGMPVARPSWFAGGGVCRDFLPSLLTSAPQSHRGAWRYSNGNYCALGLLIEALTGQPLGAALQTLIFDPLGADGLHLSTDGLLPTDAPHGADVNRFSRLGGAGTLVVSTDDLTSMTAQLRAVDLDTLRAPGIFVDQYGWGHTGTIDGAVSCLWVLEGGRTTVAATIAGNTPAKGGDICDRVVPAVADDLGIGQGRPIRTP